MLHIARRPRAKAARDIDSYALFGHAGVRTHVHAFAYLIIRPESDRIAVRAAGSELDCNSILYLYIPLISLYTCRTPQIIF